MRIHALNMKLSRVYSIDDSSRENGYIELADKAGQTVSLSFKSLYEIECLGQDIVEAARNEFRRLQEQKKSRGHCTAPASTSTESAIEQPPPHADQEPK